MVYGYITYIYIYPVTTEYLKENPLSISHGVLDLYSVVWPYMEILIQFWESPWDFFLRWRSCQSSKITRFLTSDAFKILKICPVTCKMISNTNPKYQVIIFYRFSVMSVFMKWTDDVVLTLLWRYALKWRHLIGPYVLLYIFIR